MNGLLGRIIGVEEVSQGRWWVRWTPECLMPGREPAPAWLHDVELEVERIGDRREIGRSGDKLVVSPAEAERWLHPLVVEPAVVYGTIPEMLRIHLRWWADAKPPSVIVREMGYEVEVALTETADGWLVTLPTSCFPVPPTVPAVLTVNCGPFTADCTVLPAEAPFIARMLLPIGAVYRLGNAWCSVDVSAQAGGGVISSWHAHGRDVDLFSHPDSLICDSLDVAGYADTFHLNGQRGKLRKVALAGGIDGGRLRMSAGVKHHLHTTLTCQLLDDLPLLSWERVFYLGADRSPVHSFAPGYRVAWANGADCRFHCVAHGRPLTRRLAQLNHTQTALGWWPEDGWMLIEHPRGVMLYLFDPQVRPDVKMRLTPFAFELAARWPARPLHAHETVGLTVAMAAGECWGVEATGGWVGCRSLMPDGVRCAMIGRLPVKGHAVFTLGTTRRTVPLQALLLPTVGCVAMATADFPGASLSLPLHITMPEAT